MGRLRLLALAAATALAVAGCGTASSTVSTKGLQGQGKAVAQAIASLQSDAQSGDASKVCADLAPSLAKRLADGAGGSCADALSDQLKLISDYSLSVTSIKITGDTATARVKDVAGGKTHHDTLRLVKVGGDWKIAGL